MQLQRRSSLWYGYGDEMAYMEDDLQGLRYSILVVGDVNIEAPFGGTNTPTHFSVGKNSDLGRNATEFLVAHGITNDEQLAKVEGDETNYWEFNNTNWFEFVVDERTGWREVGVGRIPIYQRLYEGEPFYEIEWYDGKPCPAMDLAAFISEYHDGNLGN